MRNIFKELYDYRQMIKMMVRREIRGRYKGSVLGFFWTFLNPLLQFAVYSVVFSGLLNTGIEKFYLYVFVGFVPWYFVSSTVPEGAECITEQKEMVQKIYFPRIVLPLSTTLSGLVNMMLSEIVVMAVLMLNGYWPTVHLLALPVVVLVQFILVLGIVLLVSSVNVYLRDVSHIMNILIMVWFYATPVVYPPESMSGKFAQILRLNPMTSVISSYRQILYYRCWPDFSSLLPAAVIGTLLLAAGVYTFQRLQRGFAEEL